MRPAWLRVRHLFFRVAAHVTRQCNYAVFDLDAYFLGVNRRFPREFGDHVRLQLCVCDIPDCFEFVSAGMPRSDRSGSLPADRCCFRLVLHRPREMRTYFRDNLLVGHLVFCLNGQNSCF
jgi:hypothetical protein